jgi:hypothetical protein
MIGLGPTFIGRLIVQYSWMILTGGAFVGCNGAKIWSDAKSAPSGDQSQETRPGADHTENPKGPAKMVVQFQPAPLRSLGEVEGLGAKEKTIREDLQKSFCIFVYRLSLKSDFSKEIGLLCDETRAPRPLFGDLDRYSKVTGDQPQGVELEYKIDNEFVESTSAIIYEVPIPTRYFKEARIQEYMMVPADFDYFRFESKIAADLGEELGGDLQFGKYKLAYKSVTRTKDGKIFANDRETEMNTYQVQGGETNLGFGTEHLLGKNIDYVFLNTITITIGTKAGGTALLSISRVKVRHNGYPENARRLPIDTATAQATHVRDGVLVELASKIIK